MIISPIIQLTQKHLQLFVSADPSLDLVKSYLKRCDCFEAILEQNQVVGVIALLPTRPDTIEVVNIAVSQEFQNQGIGSKLLDFALDYSKNAHYKTINIGTGSTSLAQLYLYQKIGFRIVGIDKNFFVRHYEQPIVENGLILKDMLRLSLDLH